MIRVLGARVLVALPPVPPEKVTDSGLILMRDPDLLKTPTKGIVLQLGRKSNTCDLDEVRSAVHTWFVEHASDCSHAGPRTQWQRVRDDVDRLLMQMPPAPFDVQVGDVVLFLPTSGEILKEGDVEYALLHESEIIGIVEPAKKEAA